MKSTEVRRSVINPPGDADLLYGVPAIAQHLGMRQDQARNRIRQGLIPAFKMGGTICSQRVALTRWLAEQSTGITRPTASGGALTSPGPVAPDQAEAQLLALLSGQAGPNFSVQIAAAGGRWTVTVETSPRAGGMAVGRGASFVEAWASRKEV